jgi:hypothetical protein
VDRAPHLTGLVVAELGSISGPSIHRAEQWSEGDIEAAAMGLRQLAGELSLREPILFVQSPGWWPILLRARAELKAAIVYDCLDEHSGWDADAASSVRAAEECVVRTAHLILTTARSLARRLSAMAWNVLLVPNGCDFSLFARAAVPNGRWRGSHPRPIVGFFGSVGDAWFDVQLVLAAASMRPEWSFVLVGPGYGGILDVFKGVPNIHLTGEVPYERLPDYCADFDVAIIPWLVNDLTLATDPVKLWEYFAAGLPVVATPMPELYPLQGLLDIVDDPISLIEAIDRLFHRPGDRAARQAVARSADWQARVDLFYEEMLAVGGA